VVAAGVRLDHDSPPAIGEEPREEDARLDLRARNRQFVADGRQRSPALDDQGRVAILRCNVCAHLGERIGDPPKRPARQRLVADQLEAPLLPDEQPRQEPHQRPRVPAVDRALRSPEPAKAHPADANGLSVDFHIGTERPYPRRRRERVRRRTEAGEATLAVCDRPEEESTVRDRLVAGHG
jgi:hypothetical protein